MNGESGKTLIEEQLHSLDRPESLCAIDEFEELWNVKDDPIEERNCGGGNNRSVYPDQEVLQVIANALELQLDESGEVNGCQRRWTLASPIGAGTWGLEFEGKGSEVGQCGQACGHHFGRNVPSMWYLIKLEIDKISRRQKKFW
jgi:hypothetical protein